jgi:hypothetical protein
MVTTASRMFQRRRTAAQWTSENPVLGAGEIGVETDTLAVKVGNGATAWTSLAYLGLSAQAQATLLGRAAGAGTGTPTALTATQAKAALALTAADSANTPAGTIVATTVQAALNELDADLQALPEVEADDPTELDIDVVGGVATLALLDRIARLLYKHRSGQYYVQQSHASLATGQTLTQDQVCYFPVILSAGVIDRIGIEVTTAAASGILRFGIYTDDGGLPLNLIAQATTTADASTTGVKDLTISATIPRNGLYWLALVAQGATTIGVRASNIAQDLSLPLGTTPPSGTSHFNCRTQSGVTGALPASATVGAVAATKAFIFFRYA